MKKIISCILSILIIICFASSLSWSNVSANQESISNKIIRFHVIANSDTDSDQALKLKVRDAVLSYLSPKLETSKNIDESKTILKNNDTMVLKIAEKIIKENGYAYKVVSDLSRENFPVKSYGPITLPQGNYQAYRIVIGSGEGHNWWCVMFPPLCFVDITKGQVAINKTQGEMKKVLTVEEYDLVDNTRPPTEEIQDKYIIRFKIVDWFNEIFN
ncbi:MAG: stage II sporulation protein R [Clostridiaceae bacterium]|nr:stage II sporulation protein R [Clostridiaceae bacterium]